MDPAAEHGDHPHSQHSPQLDNFLAQAHPLVDHYIAEVQQLREVHKQYEAMEHEEMSDEERRAAFREILRSELVLLEEARVVQQELLALLNDFQSPRRFGE